MKIDLQLLAKKAFEASKAKGFYDGPDAGNIPLKLALIHSEVSEALEELRKNPDLLHTYERESDGKPEGFLFELADAVIRILDLVGFIEFIDPERASLFEDIVLQKMKFNESRPTKHNKNF